jgi:hypothetical protein
VRFNDVVATIPTPTLEEVEAEEAEEANPPPATRFSKREFNVYYEAESLRTLTEILLMYIKWRFPWKKLPKAHVLIRLFTFHFACYQYPIPKWFTRYVNGLRRYYASLEA